MSDNLLPAIEKKSRASKKSKASKRSAPLIEDTKGSEVSMMAAEQNLPGESADGRMGSDIQLLISDITDYRDLLDRHKAEDKANHAAIQKEVELLEYRQMKIESRLQKRRVAKQEYEKTLADTERAFNQIVNTANSVANILKPPTADALSSMEMPEIPKNA